LKKGIVFDKDSPYRNWSWFFDSFLSHFARQPVRKDTKPPTGKRNSRRPAKGNKSTSPIEPHSQEPSAKHRPTVFRNKDKELKGIPEAILDERKESSVCSRCGKGGHLWFICRTSEPVVDRLPLKPKQLKRKRDGDSGGTSQTPKKRKFATMKIRNTKSTKAAKSRTSTPTTRQEKT
jgi:hypothetical protein